MPHRPLFDAAPSGKRTENLRELVLERIRTAITTGDLPEGTLLTAPGLAETLGVSTTPVREAMMDLVHDGLVESVKNKGFRVTSMSDEELEHLTAVRLILEPAAMRMLQEAPGSVAISELQQLADQCSEAAQVADLERYVRLDREFHVKLLQLSGNPELVRIATSLRRKTRMFGLHAVAHTGQLTQAASEHHTLVTMLTQKHFEEAAVLLSEHISHALGSWSLTPGRQV